MKNIKIGDRVSGEFHNVLIGGRYAKIKGVLKKIEDGLAIIESDSSKTFLIAPLNRSAN